MPFVPVNNFNTTLGGALTNSATTLSVATGQGANYPTIASPNFSYLTIIEGTTIEVVKVTAHTQGVDNDFVIVRGADSIRTTAGAGQTFTSAAKVSGRLPVVALNNFVELDQDETITGLKTFSHASGIGLTGQTADPAAVSGILKLFNRIIAGRHMPKWVAPSGVDYIVQPSFFGNQVAVWKPGTGTTLGTQLGVVFSSNGTLATPAITTSAPVHFNQVRRQTWANVVTTTNQALGLSAAVAMVWRGNAAGLGGFFFHARVAFPIFPAGTRVFIGLSSLLTTGMVTADVVGTTGQYIGLGMIAGDTNLTIMHSDGTTLTKDALSPAQARLTNTWFDVFIFCAPNQSSINVRVDRFDQATGVQTTIYDAAVSTTIPAAATILAPHILMSNGTANTTVTSTQIACAGAYLESDF